MKKIIISSLLVLGASSVQAYQLQVENANLKPNDTFSLTMKTVAGDCKIKNGKYDCETINNSFEGLPIKYMKDYFDAIQSGSQKEKLVELDFKVNGQAFPSCQQLQEVGQKLKITLSDSGCVASPLG